MKKMRTWLLLGLVEEVYHRHEGESSQEHLEGSRLNVTSRMNWAMRRMGEGIWDRRGQERGLGGKRPGVSQESKRAHSQNAWICIRSEAGEEKWNPGTWKERFSVGSGVRSTGRNHRYWVRLALGSFDTWHSKLLLMIRSAIISSATTFC